MAEYTFIENIVCPSCQKETMDAKMEAKGGPEPYMYVVCTDTACAKLIDIDLDVMRYFIQTHIGSYDKINWDDWIDVDDDGNFVDHGNEFVDLD